MSQKWCVVDCAKYPSETNCQLRMAVPEDRKDDLVDAATVHMVTHHKHADNQETRQMVQSAIETQEW